MSFWNNYYLADSIEEALQALENATGDSRVIAGGTDLLLDLQQGRHPPVHALIDISNIPELTALELRGGELFIGAAVPLARVISSPLVAEHANALLEAASLIGGPQVRNTATLGGNVGHALPAGDGTIALLCLDARVEVASKRGFNRLPVRELFIGPGKSTLNPRGELIVGFYLPLQKPGQASAFKRIMRPQGVAIAILNMGVWLYREVEKIGEIRISLGPAGPVPARAEKTEEFLRGKTPCQENFRTAAEVLLTEGSFRTSPHRATSAYRQKMAAFLLEETISRAWELAAELEPHK